MKRQLTAEQTAARDARRQKFKALWKQVAAMPELERIQLSHKYGFRTVTGHELSLANQMLIALQLPGASVLGGFRQWIKNGRAVRKGEHGAMIWCPSSAKANPNAQPPNIGQGITEDGESFHDQTRFIVGTVFDIAQTEEIETGETTAAPVAAEVEAV